MYVSLYFSYDGYGCTKQPAAGLPSRSSVLVAAVRAFGSREPDESVRNPDSMAELLIGPSELALIRDHPVSTALMLDYAEASDNPAIMLFAGLMLRRTRFIDEGNRSTLSQYLRGKHGCH